MTIQTKKSLGTRTTKTKDLVEKILHKSSTPLALHELFLKIRRHYPTTAFSTVYRIVKNLEARNMVLKTDWKNRGGRFEWANRPHHHHLVCEKCESVEDINDKLLSFNEKKVSRNTGYIIKHHSIELTGICQPCQKK